VTCGIPFNFAVLNSPVTVHLTKRIINPNGETILMKPMVLYQVHGGYLSEKFQTHRISNFGDIAETVTAFLQKKSEN